jgi:cellulose synthase/poly-beta-1,6-N-acetylglucosamine synthase-like glycosyltransferase
MDVIFYIALVFAAGYFFLLMYFLLGWLRLDRRPDLTLPAEPPSLSVIIPVRNEANHIAACLDAILNQNYPRSRFEIIVIDDYSTDGTLEILLEYQSRGLKILSLKDYLGYQWENSPNKKKAISLGIKNAAGELIVTTDGDTCPGEQWLSALVAGFINGQYKLMTAPVIIKPARWPGEIFQQLDVIGLAGITGASLRYGNPLMCNGANMIYARNTFHEVEGFKGNYDIPSGDDIFLLRKVEEKFPGKTGFLAAYEAVTGTRAASGPSEFVQQRIRWASKSVRYQGKTVSMLLLMVYLYYLLIPALLAGALADPNQFLIPAVLAAGVKLLSELIFMFPLLLFFRKWYAIFVLPFASVWQMLYVIIVGPLTLTGRYYWKDRPVR